MATIEKHVEAEWWNELYNEANSAKLRKRYGLRFREIFREGHAESLREFVSEAATVSRNGLFYRRRRDPFFKYLSRIHPETFDLLAKYGIDYVPAKITKLPDFIEPRAGRCYLNASILAHVPDTLRAAKTKLVRPPYAYVEGIAFGAMCFPMLHAWNARGLRAVRAIDWTLYATCRWTRYRGIPFSRDEHAELSDMSGYVQVFSEESFTPRVKARLIEVLERRRAEND